jgi:transcriptional regulator with XRE-family HTH domain
VNSLGAYLRARRAALTPEQAGLPDDGRRRVPGLRREEVAAQAGLSTDYYVRLEQGRADRPSDAVLSAVARVLQLGAAERAHLFDLARATRPATASAPLRPALIRVVDAITEHPALVMSPITDVLAWNALAAELIADFTREPNMARLLFLDPHARDTHPDWERAARDTVGILRMAVGRGQESELIDELTHASPAFSRLWSSHHVHEKSHGPKLLRHPVEGVLELEYESFAVPGAPGQMLVVYTAATVAAHEALRRLVSAPAAARTAR